MIGHRHPFFLIENINVKNFMFGIVRECPSTPKNILLLHLKYYIWIIRCREDVGGLTPDRFYNWFKSELKWIRLSNTSETFNYIDNMQAEGIEELNNQQ